MSKNQKIMNYTSTVPVNRTIGNIEEELIKMGVSRIEKSYSNGKPVALIFSVELPHPVSFKLPANIKSAYKVLKGLKEYKSKKDEWLWEQAERTAWKILYDSVRVDSARIQLEQVNAMEIFLSYIYDHNTGMTFFEKLNNSGFKALTE